MVIRKKVIRRVKRRGRGGSCAWAWVLGPALGKEVPAHAQHVSGLDGFEQSVVDAIKGSDVASKIDRFMADTRLCLDANVQHNIAVTTTAQAK